MSIVKENLVFRQFVALNKVLMIIDQVLMIIDKVLMITDKLLTTI